MVWYDYDTYFGSLCLSGTVITLRRWKNITYKKIVSSIFLLMIVTGVIFSFPQKRIKAAVALWLPIEKGIAYREFYLAGFNKVYVVRMERNNPSVILETSIGLGKLSGGTERVSDMVQRYDQAINYWQGQWGNRNKVVAAINGFFFDKDTGIPWQGQVQSGWYAKRFEDFESGSGIVWKLDRNIFIGGCVAHRPAKQFITFYPAGEKLQFDGINIPRQDNSIVLYTPQYDSTTLTEDNGVEVLVDVSSPTMIISAPKMVKGRISLVEDNSGSMFIPFDSVVISASGTKAHKLLNLAKVGSEVGITQEVKSFKDDCKTKSSNNWDRTYAGIGGSFHFLINGEIVGSDNLGSLYRNARTAVVYNENYIYFVVLSAKEEILNPGLSIVELAAFAKGTLGATEGIALDGGGSSTLVVNGEIKNMPADLERPVANGLMMVVVEAAEKSQKFQTGDTVLVIGENNIDLRLGPGTNLGVRLAVPPNSQGVIVKHLNNLDGVFAKNAYWWKVSVNGITGWIKEDNLQKIKDP